MAITSAKPLPRKGRLDKLQAFEAGRAAHFFYFYFLFFLFFFFKVWWRAATLFDLFLH
jgi:hypothetical protein